MFFEQLRVGGDRNFGYVIGCDVARVCAIVDPSTEPDVSLGAARDAGLDVRWVIATHGHADHVAGNDTIVSATGARVVAHPGCPIGPDVGVPDGGTLDVGELTVSFRYTPGHSPDSLVVLVEDVVLTGDTLFVGKIGGTRTRDDARTQFASLHGVLMRLPDATRVFPGHDVGVSPHSTIGDERRTNPFLCQPDFDAFLDLKLNWAAYKKAHGIA